MLELIMKNYFPFVICITLFGFLIVHRFSLYRQNELIRITAANSFISIFTSELSEIYPVASKWPEDIDIYLRQKFPVLQSAVEIYKPFVKDQVGFNKAWEFYRLGEEGRLIDKQLYHQYMGFQSNNDPVTDPEIQIFDNLNKILAYAKT